MFLLNASCLPEGGRGIYNVVGRNVGVQKREAKWLFLNENPNFLRIKCSNLQSQTKEQDLLVLLRTSKTRSKY